MKIDRLLWPALLGPAAVVAYAVDRYGVNVPSWDQWTLVNPLVQIAFGRFPWAEIFGQHNEHRMVFPKLIMLGLAQLTQWNILAELWTSIVLAGCSLILLVALARPVLRESGAATRLWAGFILSASVFSLAQWENWLWGWQIQWLLGTLAAISVVALTTWSLRSPRPWRYVAPAAFAAIICQYSIASGVAIWLSGAMILAFHSHRRRLLPAWLALAAGMTGLYFIGYAGNPDHPSPLTAIERPLAFLVYIGNYLSGPLGRHVAIGYAAAAAFALAATLTVSRLRREPELVLPWLAIGVFVGANAVLTAIGRVGMGAEQGLQSRYVTVSLLLVVALVMLGITAFRGAREKRPTLPRSVAAAASAILLTVLVARTDLDSFPGLINESLKMTEARDCVLRIDEASDACLGKLFPDPHTVRHWTKQLQALGWGGFPAHAAQPRGTIRIAGSTGTRLWRLHPEAEPAGWIDKAVLDGNGLTVTGWAAHPDRAGGGPHKVIVTTGDALKAEAMLVGEAVTGEAAPLVEEFYRDPTLRYSGWTLRVTGLPAADPPLRFRAYLVIRDGILTPIGGSVTLSPAS